MGGNKPVALPTLLIGIFLTFVTTAIIFLIIRINIFTGVVQVLMIVAGMTTAAAITAFQRFIESGMPLPFIKISFNEVFISKSISEGLTEPEHISLGHEELEGPWDLSPGQLVGVDNSLALARLRMDIERALRHVAYKRGIDIATRPYGVIGLTQELVSKEILPPTLLGGLKEIVSICNKAIHGVDIPNGTAAAVIRVGVQLIERLRLISKK